MTIQLPPGPVSGVVSAIPSKSVAHRLLICAALGVRPTVVSCAKESQDMAATVRCLTALGADITRQEGAYHVTPLDRAALRQDKTPRLLDCGESGSTLRFLLPVVCALGVTGSFQLAGRLAQRPMEPLSAQLRAHGCTITPRPEENRLDFSGALTPGAFTLPGNVSSQFISGLLFALPLLSAESTLTVTGPMESVGYLHLTLQALAQFSVTPTQTETGWTISPTLYRGEAAVSVEGDWSNAAPWLCMGVLGGPGLTVTGLLPDSLQGDKGICKVLQALGGRIIQNGTSYTAVPGMPPMEAERTIDARDIPDLVPVLSAVAAVTPGETRITGAARLRIKESDRLMTTREALNALGGDVTETADGLIIRGKPHLTGGTVDAQGDHRIAMLAAVASVVSQAEVTLTGAQAIQKSYPGFWEEVGRLRFE